MKTRIFREIRLLVIRATLIPIGDTAERTIFLKLQKNNMNEDNHPESKSHAAFLTT